jgi:YVTN family beta-propeller protein
MVRRLCVAVLTLVCAADVAPQGSGTPAAGKLFVDVSAADYIEVVDLATRRVVDRIVVGKRPHGLAVDRRTVGGRVRDLLYVTVEDTGELVAVDAQSHQILARVPVGHEPNQLTITRDGRFAYVPLRGEASVAVVDLGISTGADLRLQPKVIKRIPIGEWPHNSYTGQTTGQIYVATFRGKKIHVFDPAKHELLFEIEFPGEVRPVALSKDETRAYVAQSDFHGFLVTDVAARRVIGRVELPALPPGTPEPYLKTYVHGLALSPDERELWVTSCAGAAVYVYSLPDLVLRGKISMGKFPHWFAWEAPRAGAEGKNTRWLLWVSQMESNQVSVLDPSTRKLVATVPTGPAPRRIAIPAPH